MSLSYRGSDQSMRPACGVMYAQSQCRVAVSKYPKIALQCWRSSVGKVYLSHGCFNSMETIVSHFVRLVYCCIRLEHLETKV